MAEPKTPAGAEAPAAEPKKSKLILAVVAVVVLIALGGGGYVVMSRRAIAKSKGGAKPAAAQDAPPVAMIPLDSFLVNLADPGHQAFLRVGISLGLSKPLAESGDSANQLPWVPEVRDAVLSVLTTWQSTDLLASNGKTKLKAELLRVLQQRVPQLGITGVYFTDFLIQQ